MQWVEPARWPKVADADNSRAPTAITACMDPLDSQPKKQDESRLNMRDEPGRRESDEDDPEGAEQNQEPGHRQKRNQSDEEEDPLAA